MFSVLIPVYNFDIRPLVLKLVPQLESCGFPYEVVVADDASTNIAVRNLNSEIEKIRNVKYIRFDVNQGRSKIRNFLSDIAQFEFLVFLDCDAMVKNGDFIANYLKFINDNNLKDKTFAVIGGVSYRDEKPPRQKRLRYKYGVNREVHTATSRQANPYSRFTPFNLLISKSVFDICRFDESLTQYGYEDTFFGIDLKRAGIPIYHIDNQMYHDGIVEDKTFLKQIDNACYNLVKLVSECRENKEFVANSRLLQVLYKLKSSFIGRIILYAIAKFDKLFRKLAISCNSLIALDFYKLACVTKNSEKLVQM